MTTDRSLTESLPHPSEVRERLGGALREIVLLRRMLRLCERAEEFRAVSRKSSMRDRGEPRHG
jgi:hypothetical protein